MIIYVIDASVGVKWFIEEEYSDRADELLSDFQEGIVELVAPKSFMQEFCNAIRKYVVRGYLSRDLANQHVEKMAEMPIDYVDLDWKIIKESYAKALELSITVYDAIYVVIADKLGATIITSDNKLYNQLRDKARIMHIRDYQRISR